MKLIGKLCYFLFAFFILFGACKKDKTSPIPENNGPQTFHIYGTWNIDSVRTSIYENDSLCWALLEVKSPYYLEFLTNGMAYYKWMGGIIDTSNYFFNDSTNQLMIDMDKDNILDSGILYKIDNSTYCFSGNTHKEIVNHDTSRTEVKYYINK